MMTDKMTQNESESEYCINRQSGRTSTRLTNSTCFIVETGLDENSFGFVWSEVSSVQNCSPDPSPADNNSTHIAALGPEYLQE